MRIDSETTNQRRMYYYDGLSVIAGKLGTTTDGQIWMWTWGQDSQDSTRFGVIHDKFKSRRKWRFS